VEQVVGIRMRARLDPRPPERDEKPGGGVSFNNILQFRCYLKWDVSFVCGLVQVGVLKYIRGVRVAGERSDARALT